MSDLTKLGFIGIGLIGKPMTLRLLAGGEKEILNFTFTNPPP